MSKAVVRMRGQVAQLEHNVEGLLALGGDGSVQVRAPQALDENGTAYRKQQFRLAIAEQAVRTTNLARGLAGQLLLAQGNAAVAYRAVGGDATLDQDGVLDLAAGAVELDELRGLDEAEIIIGGRRNSSG